MMHTTKSRAALLTAALVLSAPLAACASSGSSPLEPDYPDAYQVVDTRTGEVTECAHVHIWQGTLYCGISTEVAFPPGTWDVPGCEWCNAAK